MAAQGFPWVEVKGGEVGHLEYPTADLVVRVLQHRDEPGRFALDVRRFNLTDPETGDGFWTKRGVLIEATDGSLADTIAKLAAMFTTAAAAFRRLEVEGGKLSFTPEPEKAPEKPKAGVRVVNPEYKLSVEKRREVNAKVREYRAKLRARLEGLTRAELLAKLPASAVPAGRPTKAELIEAIIERSVELVKRRLVEQAA